MALTTPRRGRLRWAVSKTIGGVSEIAVLAPIKAGCVDGERRTYEERLRGVIDNLAGRHRQGAPIDLNRIPAIHFGRLTILRPEQYLFNSQVRGVGYYPGDIPARGASDGSDQPEDVAPGGLVEALAQRVPKPFDDFAKPRPSMAPPPRPRSHFSSFLLTQVEFDGDLRVYMRDIAHYLDEVFGIIFENCEAFPGTTDFEQFWLWVRRHQINTDLLYAPYGHLSAVRIRRLEQFKRRFDAFVARVRTPQGQRIGVLDDEFDAFLRENQQIAENFPTPGGLFLSNSPPGWTL
jgi:hypothetical protein